MSIEFANPSQDFPDFWVGIFPSLVFRKDGGILLKTRFRSIIFDAILEGLEDGGFLPGGVTSLEV